MLDACVGLTSLLVNSGIYPVRRGLELKNVHIRRFLRLTLRLLMFSIKICCVDNRAGGIAVWMTRVVAP